MRRLWRQESRYLDHLKTILSLQADRFCYRMGELECKSEPTLDHHDCDPRTAADVL